MQDRKYIPFTKEMKRDYKILVPNMLPVHFKLIISVMRTYGFNMELLETTGKEIAETGLKYTHNDTCYPAILVIGQFIDALQSGKYDPQKTALIMFQTGGGCRASNYISLIRKALAKAGYGYIPVISFSLLGLENHPGFKLSIKMLKSMFYAAAYGDLMMSLANQTKPYEVTKGDTDRLCAEYTEKLGRELGSGKKSKYKDVLENCRKMVDDFAKIPLEKREAVRVGIVGEIFVKYSPLANNGLEDFLISEGAEPVVPGLLDFCLFFIYNEVAEFGLYRMKVLSHPVFKIAYKKLCDFKRDINNIIKEEGSFRPWTDFEDVVKIAKSVINTAVKMGEGWLLTAEMIELAESGCPNVVCTQPFGCLPNHICGKGMMKPIKEMLPGVNIVAIDYDAGASRVNQENRLKLMLANAKKESAEKTADKAAETPSSNIGKSDSEIGICAENKHEKQGVNI